MSRERECERKTNKMKKKEKKNSIPVFRGREAHKGERSTRKRKPLKLLL